MCSGVFPLKLIISRRCWSRVTLVCPFFLRFDISFWILSRELYKQLKRLFFAYNNLGYIVSILSFSIVYKLLEWQIFILGFNHTWQEKNAHYLHVCPTIYHILSTFTTIWCCHLSGTKCVSWYLKPQMVNFFAILVQKHSRIGYITLECSAEDK